MDHEVVLDAGGRLMAWTTYERILVGSMNYIENCATEQTVHGQDPWFLITSKLNEDGSFRRNQNNQASNAYYAVETLRRYYPYTGDGLAQAPIRLLLDRVLEYRTPADWKWPDVPRTQDNSPDGVYDDETSEVDKICMVGIACLRFARMTGEEKYVEAAKRIAETVLAHVDTGDEERSPLPFRVNLKSGEVLDSYTAGMVFCSIFFDEVAALGGPQRDRCLAARDTLWEWVLRYPISNQRWSGYYEDVRNNRDNLNQQIPLETARRMLERFDDRSEYAQHIPALIEWVRNRFGRTKRRGATSIREQDGCFEEMSSHTARYASVVAGWWALCEQRGLLDPERRAALYEEARSSFALCTYSTWSKHSIGDRALNYVGLGYIDPWFSDSYFDFLPHLLDGLAFLPSLNAPGQVRLLRSTDTMRQVEYKDGGMTYETVSDTGEEWLLCPFSPRLESGGVEVPKDRWIHGPWLGAEKILRLRRAGERSVTLSPR
ncbi:MAG: hypothetical protein HUU16_17685 [Candidatus Omnitrophica bacterium]|nr:hypothetical protein [Candidatus Omnitrophota bacterium]